MTTTGEAPAPAAQDPKPEDIALRIASSGPDMGIEVPKSAPDSGNTGKVSPEPRQPDSSGQGDAGKTPEPKKETVVEGAKITNGADGKPVQTPAAAATPSPEEAAKAEAEAEQQLIRSRMGLKPVEPDTVESLRRKHAESSREAHRLVEESKLRDQALSASGIKIIKKADGTFGIMADEAKMAEGLKNVMPTVLNALSDEEKTLVQDAVAKKIIEQTLAAVAVSNPKSTATEKDMVLPDHEIQGVLNGLASEKLPDKTDLYQGLTDNDFVGYMQEIYSSPELEPFRVVANQSRENMKEFLKLLHGSVYRGFASVLAKKADKAAQQKIKDDEHAREPSPQPSGAPPVDAKTPAGETGAAIAKRIASAG